MRICAGRYFIVAVHAGHLAVSEYRNLGTGQASSGMEGASRTACRGLWLVLETALRQMKAPGTPAGDKARQSLQ